VLGDERVQLAGVLGLAWGLAAVAGRVSPRGRVCGRLGTGRCRWRCVREHGAEVRDGGVEGWGRGGGDVSLLLEHCHVLGEGGELVLYVHRVPIS
jgi:hypothetical protein